MHLPTDNNNISRNKEKDINELLMYRNILKIVGSMSYGLVILFLMVVSGLVGLWGSFSFFNSFNDTWPVDFYQDYRFWAMVIGLIIFFIFLTHLYIFLVSRYVLLKEKASESPSPCLSPPRVPPERMRRFDIIALIMVLLMCLSGMAALMLFPYFLRKYPIFGTYCLWLMLGAFALFVIFWILIRIRFRNR